MLLSFSQKTSPGDGNELMRQKYCHSCAAQLMSQFKTCPTCGSSSFSDRPPGRVQSPPSHTLPYDNRVRQDGLSRPVTARIGAAVVAAIVMFVLYGFRDDVARMIGSFHQPTVVIEADQVADTSSNNRDEVGVTHVDGVSTVTARINDTINLDFIVDSGAADVQIPLDVVKLLMKTGAITESDIGEEKIYTIADGSTMKNREINIKKIKIGKFTVSNVQGSIASEDSPLLLGQAFFKKFRNWSIDNEKNILILVK